jgi:hypothetical protein
MKTSITSHKISIDINPNWLGESTRKIAKSLSLPMWLAIAVTCNLGFVTKPVRAENTGAEDIQHYMQPQGVLSPSGKVLQDADQKNQQMPPLGTETKTEKSSSSSEQAQGDPKNEPVEKPTDGKGQLPFFVQADVNNDHYITKDELQNFPYLLQVFDKVDAGNDGKLEQHEYQSLKMQTKREAQIR